MSVLELEDTALGLPFFKEERARTVGQSYAEIYRTAEPFPHVVVDDFVSEDLLRKLIAEFPAPQAGLTFARAQELMKPQHHPADCAPFTRHLLQEWMPPAIQRSLKGRKPETNED